MGLLDRLLTPKKLERPPREILAEAIAEIGHPSLVQAALDLFDSPQPLIATWEEEQGDLPAWADSERPGSAAELAFQVFEHILREDQRVGYLDWSAGEKNIEVEFNKMFARADKTLVSDAERNHMSQVMGEARKRDPRALATSILWDYMHELARARGLHLDWLHTGGDCHYPILMTPGAHEKWRNARFGKGVDVLP